MNNKILLLALLLLANFRASTQVTSFGLKAKIGEIKLNVESDLPPNDITQPLPVTSYGLGAFVNISPKRFFAVQAELNLTSQGFSTKNEMELNGNRYDFSNKMDIYYLQIPVLAQLRSGGKKFHVYLDAGLSFAYAASGKAHFTTRENGYVIEDSSEDINFENADYSELDRTQWGRHLGTGISLRVDDILITLGAQQFRSMSTFNREVLPYNTNFRWSGWHFTVGCATVLD